MNKKSEMTDKERENYRLLVAEMDSLLALPSLSHEQAERWASLCNYRYLMFIDERTWARKAVQHLDRRWYLIPMHMPLIPRSTRELY